MSNFLFRTETEEGGKEVKVCHSTVFRINVCRSLLLQSSPTVKILLKGTASPFLSVSLFTCDLPSTYVSVFPRETLVADSSEEFTHKYTHVSIITCRLRVANNLI